jgi:hypothetical protein
MPLAIGDPSDGYLDVVTKLIPGETAFLYSAATSIAASRAAASVLLAGGVLLVPSILWLSARRARRPAPAAQYVVRTLAFVAWVFTVDNRLLALETRWIPAIAVVILPLLGSLLFPLGVRR